MYSPHNCSCLPNKNQSAFTSSIPQNLGIFRTFTAQSFSKYEDCTRPMHLPLNVDVSHRSRTSSSIQYDKLNLPTKTSSIMDLAINFRDDTSKFKIRNSTTKFTSCERTRPSYKTLFSTYDSVTTMPLVSSYLVGGFVGSKSQLGRRPAYGLGVNMWDIVLDFLGHSSKPINDREKSLKATMTDLKFTDTGLSIADKKPNSINPHRPINLSSRPRPTSSSNPITEKENSENLIKQSYAEVAKARLPNNIEKPAKVMEENERHGPRRCCPNKLNRPKCMIEIPSTCTNRDRIASECSASSEDSFIVFEYCDADDKIEDDDNSSSSDEDCVLDSQYTKEEDSPVSGSASSTLSGSKNFIFSQKRKSNIKVRFAEEPSLAQVHTMVAWDYAYRAARKGPWEMLARDSERFKYRIRNVESLLTPVLNAQHRARIYQQRFADPGNH